MFYRVMQGNLGDSGGKKFWGLWLPVPTIITLINSLFWNWLIRKIAGDIEQPIEKSAEPIIQQF